MSSNLLFIEIEPSAWYYLLEDQYGEKDPFDWREQAKAFGPFATQASADEHYFNNQHSTSGAEILKYPISLRRIDDVVREKVSLAPANMAEIEAPRRRW